MEDLDLLIVASEDNNICKFAQSYLPILSSADRVV